jgi:hypothetical protein
MVPAGLFGGVQGRIGQSEPLVKRESITLVGDTDPKRSRDFQATGHGTLAITARSRSATSWADSGVAPGISSADSSPPIR